ncbi:MAG: acyltransferase family protein [Ilumatobacteraceae bacterium]
MNHDRLDAGQRPSSLSKVPYLPALDGLRALAVVAVMIYHANSAWLPGGFLGVEVFFVLSGYLITLLLLAEHDRDGSIDLRSFWARRARRLLPALFAVLTLVAVVATLLRPETLGKVRGDVIAGFFYGSNWFQLWVGAGYAASGDFAPLRHLWSLAVEEQFYLLWPLVMVAITRRRVIQVGRVVLIFVGSALVITLLVALLHHGGPIGECAVTPDAYWQISGRCFSIADVLYLSTPTRASGLLLGAAFAMVWRPNAVMRGQLGQRPARLDVVGIFGLAGLALLVTKVHYLMADPSGAGTIADGSLMRGGFLWTDLATLAILGALVHRRSTIGRVLATPPLLWLGTRSYGLYLYHWPIYQIIRRVAGVPLSLIEFVVAMLVTVAVAEVSYRYLEMPIRRGQFKVETSARAEAWSMQTRRLIAVFGLVGVVVIGFSGFRVATADLELNQIEASIAAGEQDVTSVEELLGEVTSDVSSESDQSADTGDSASDITTTTAATAVVTPQREPVQFLAIGDSVMLGAAGVLRERGYTVNAEKSRQLKGTLEFLQQLKDAGTFGDVLVVHLGTNGPIAQADLNTFMEIVIDVPLVVMLNVRGELAWRNSNNELLASIDAEDNNIVVVDWLSESKNCSGSCFGDDGIHLLGDGQVFYANVIRNITGT